MIHNNIRLRHLILPIVIFGSSFLTSEECFKKVLIMISISLTIFLFYFFRYEEFKQPVAPNNVVSPAYGRVMEIEEGDQTNTLKIHLRPYDIHAQYAPIDAEVVSISDCVDPNRHLECTSIKLERDGEQFTVQQIVNKTLVGPFLLKAFIDKRNVQFVNSGDYVIGRHHQLGMIQFGSQVNFILPKNYRILVAPGDLVNPRIRIATKK